MTDRSSIADSLTEVARELNAQHDLSSTLDAIVHAAERSLPGLDRVGISIVHRDGRIETMAGTDQMVWELDALQYELHEGPCYDSIEREAVMVANELRHDQRWPRYVPRAVAQGVRSQMGLRLFLESETLGGLNLYSTEVERIDPDVQHLAELFATHAALALGKARHVDHLNTALQTRKVIGQAIGIVMERYQLDEHRAFQFMVRVSSHSNVKLRDIAQELVDQSNHTGGQRKTDA
jgi:GAF domain-containing protein